MRIANDPDPLLRAAIPIIDLTRLIPYCIQSQRIHDLMGKLNGCQALGRTGNAPSYLLRKKIQPLIGLLLLQCFVVDTFDEKGLLFGVLSLQGIPDI